MKFQRFGGFKFCFASQFDKRFIGDEKICIYIFKTPNIGNPHQAMIRLRVPIMNEASVFNGI